MKHCNFLKMTLTFLCLTSSLAWASEERRPPRPVDLSETEGQYCEACERKKDPDLDRAKRSAQAIEDKAQNQYDNDPELLKKRIARAKERMLKRIKSRTCPEKIKDDDDEDFDSDDFMTAFDEDDQDPDEKRGGRKMKGSPFMSGGSNRLTDPMKIIAKDEEALEEVEDAIEDKLESCKRKNQKKAKSRSSMAGMGAGSGSSYGQMMNSMMMNPMPQYGSSMSSFGNMNSMPYSGFGSNYGSGMNSSLNMMMGVGLQQQNSYGINSFSSPYSMYGMGTNSGFNSGFGMSSYPSLYSNPLTQNYGYSSSLPYYSPTSLSTTIPTTLPVGLTGR